MHQPVEELGVRCAAPRAKMHLEASSALRAALLTGAFVALRALHLAPDELQALLAEAGGAYNLLLVQLPRLRSLSCLDCPWQRPASFFDSLPVRAAEAEVTAAAEVTAEAEGAAEVTAEAEGAAEVTAEMTVSAAAAAAVTTAAAKSAAAAAEAASAACCGLTSLMVCINSP